MSGLTIPGYTLQFYVQNAPPYNVRVRFVNANGAFDWQADILAADWQALIAAITAAAGTAGNTYTIPNSSYASLIKYAGAVPPLDLTT
jgi:hypothetical protein